MTPEQRSARARLAAHTRWANETDRTAATEAARAAFLDGFDLEVDPDWSLTTEERNRRADHARRAHMLRLALRSVEVRRGA